MFVSVLLMHRWWFPHLSPVKQGSLESRQHCWLLLMWDMALKIFPCSLVFIWKCSLVQELMFPWCFTTMPVAFRFFNSRSRKQALKLKIKSVFSHKLRKNGNKPVWWEWNWLFKDIQISEWLSCFRFHLNEIMLSKMLQNLLGYILSLTNIYTPPPLHKHTPYTH